MNVKTGVEAKSISFDEDIKVIAPLPNFGLFALFQVNKWLGFEGKLGMFYLRSDDFSGKINDASLSATFKAY